MALVLLLAVPASGADLQFSLGGAGQADSNVFRSTANEQWDFLFLFTPSVRLQEERQTDVSYFLDYKFPAEISTRFYDNITSVNQFLNAGGTWHANDRLSFNARNQFRYANSLSNQVSFGADATTGGQDIPIVNTERDQITSNVFDMGGTYLFTPRLSGQLKTGWQANALASANYVLHPKHRVGGGFRYSFQNFSGFPGQLGSQTNNYYFFGNWAWQIMETLNFSATLGPAIFQTKQDDTPPLASTQLVPRLLVPAGGVTFSAVEGIQDLTTGTVVTSANEGDVIVGRFANSVNGDPGCPTVPDLRTPDPDDVVPIITARGQSGLVPGCPSGILIRSSDAAALAQIDQPILLTNDNPIGAEDTSVTLFAALSLVKRWSPNLISALRYSRDQGIASGVGGSVVRDAFTLSTNWDFAERWEFLFRGDWTLRQSESLGTSVFSEALGVNLAGAAGSVPRAAGFEGTVFVQQLPFDTIDTTRWGVTGEVAHRLNKRTRAWIRLQYNQQSSRSASLGSSSDFDDFLATLGVHYTWDPIHVW
jgi:hypothetical protein